MKENIKMIVLSWFKDKKNITITVLSVLLVGAFSISGKNSVALKNANDRADNLAQEVTKKERQYEESIKNLKKSLDEKESQRQKTNTEIEQLKKEVESYKEKEQAAAQPKDESVAAGAPEAPTSPQTNQAQPVQPAVVPRETVTTRKPSVYYRNCKEVRAAGAAPIRRGDLGYGKHLDRDGDGIGCE